MTRLVTFGCSFTNYRWSTWADCLAPEFDEFENWGQSGAGNQFIFNSVMECDQRNKFGPDDTVMICWSNVMRDDRYVEHRWITLGGVATTPIYTKEFLVDHVDHRGYLIRDLALIKAVSVLLQNRLGTTWKFMSFCPITWYSIGTPTIGDTRIDDVEELYQSVIDMFLPSFNTVLPRFNGFDTQMLPSVGNDYHPSPAEHLAYLDAVLPGWVTKESTRVKMHEESINLKKDPKRSGMSAVTRL